MPLCLVDHVDAGVANQLLHAVGADVAVAAKTCMHCEAQLKPLSVMNAFTTASSAPSCRRRTGAAPRPGGAAHVGLQRRPVGEARPPRCRRAR